MSSYQKVILMGNVCNDIEVKYTPNGTAVLNVSLATNRKWKDKASGENREEAEYHRVVMYDRLAEIAAEYVSKGDPIFVDGRLKTRKWQDKDGADKYTTEIIAESMQLMGRKQEQAKPTKTSKPTKAKSFEDMEDDIPF